MLKENFGIEESEKIYNLLFGDKILNLKENFYRDGFLQYKASEMDIESKISIYNEFKKIEKDPFSSPENNRFRRYGNALIFPWDDVIKPIWLPTKLDENQNELSGYDQGDNNPEHSSIRYFSALSNQVKSSNYLNKLIVEDYELTFGLDNHNLPIYVGVHFVKLVSESDSVLGISSPDCFHQDGEPFTFAHLIYRSNSTEGGTNYIAHIDERNKKLGTVNTKNIYSEFTLINSLESFAVHDSSVCHYVSPIKKKKYDQIDAERWMILIDYSLMKQKI
jgi:hypothetical protein